MAKHLCQDYQTIVDWNGTPALENETFTQAFTYDAMNRPVTHSKADGTIEQYGYNKAGLLETVSANLRGAATATSFVTNVDYNEKGQRLDIYYGNGSKTKYVYDPLTFRLTRLLTTRNTGADILQDLNYSYDPVGNITQITDNAQETIYFSNDVIDAGGTYSYDALYRLKEATGRELYSLGMPTHSDFANNIGIPNSATNAIQSYTQLYSYDALGNIQKMKSDGKWTRNYYYDSSGNNNYLVGHTSGTTEYTYDNHGNITSMPHINTLAYDQDDQLKVAIFPTTGYMAFYCYDSAGERVRKVVHKPGGIVEQHLYLGGYEIFRKTVGGTLNLERETLTISDDQKAIVRIETKTVENGSTISNPTSNQRYQYDNHLGSACLELDSTAAIISYEEYHPFGTTSYRAGSSQTEVSLKRYKYCGTERDEETGLYYYGARYYAAWLGRFVTVDPLQFKYPYYTPFQYAGNKPIIAIDLDGKESQNMVQNNEIGQQLSIEPPTHTLNSESHNIFDIDNQTFSHSSVTNYYTNGEYIGSQRVSFEIIPNTEGGVEIKGYVSSVSVDNGHVIGIQKSNLEYSNVVSRSQLDQSFNNYLETTLAGNLDVTFKDNNYNISNEISLIPDQYANTIGLGGSVWGGALTLSYGDEIAQGVSKVTKGMPLVKAGGNTLGGLGFGISTINNISLWKNDDLHTSDVIDWVCSGVLLGAGVMATGVAAPVVAVVGIGYAIYRTTAGEKVDKKIDAKYDFNNN